MRRVTIITLTSRGLQLYTLILSSITQLFVELVEYATEADLGIIRQSFFHQCYKPSIPPGGCEQEGQSTM